MTAETGAIIVVGSLHYDIMIDAPRLPVRGETLSGYRWFPKFGGKGGNQAVAASLSGQPTRLVGAVGDDAFGRHMIGHLEEAGLSKEFVEIKPGHPTGMSVAISEDQGDYGAVIVSGVNLELSEAILDRAGLWHDAAVLMLQNEVAEDLNLAVARRAKARGVLVCLNAAPMRPMTEDLVKLIDILIVNAVEAKELSDITVEGLSSAGTAASELTSRFQTVIVTAGSHGVALAKRGGGKPKRIPGKPVEVVSTHGAGDVFAGSFCAALAFGEHLDEAAQVANERAALHVAGKLIS